jgi:dihydrodipicolinate synthase/N-acetylneuraminate lyase
MSKTNALHVNGIVPIVPTPLTIQEPIDWPLLRRLVDFACATGTCAMCLPRFPGELYKLSESQRLQLVAEAGSAAVRPLTLQLDRHTEDRIAFLNGRIVALLDQPDLARHPSLLPSREGVLEA